MHGMRRGSMMRRLDEIIANTRVHFSFFHTSVLLAIFGVFSSLQAQTPVTAGYRDFNYGSTVIPTPTAEKPESKLWWNDGYWWGSLWDPAANKYRIHRFESSTQSWINVGPDIDDRAQSLADALWDGQKLYVASHIYGGRSQQSGNTTPSNSGRLYRYSYHAATDTYTLDAGFPVLVNSAESETLVLDKDSTGKLWVTWTQAKKVYVNHNLGDDLTWGTPFSVPVQGADLDGDDISTLIAFGGGKIGVLWSNQIDLKVYFAVHLDGDPDTQWQPRETALADADLGAVADDHLNVKLMSAEGNLYAVTKTSLSGSSSPRIFALKRTASGVWTRYVVANGSEKYTRPIVVLDEENGEMYVFASSNGSIRKKQTSLSNINFPDGAGEAFIQSSGSVDINDPTASKHNVNSTTGLLVLASDEIGLNYYHNYIPLASSGSPTISSFSPTNGPVGTLVTITGNNFNGVTSVAFNGIAAASFTVDTNTQITATVPAGATTGKISVTKPAGTAVSANDFTVTAPTQYTLTVNVVGSGSVALSPPGGTYDSGTMVTLTATPNSGYQFSGWSGDLSGSTNPATITMNANKNVTATFTAISPNQYTLTVNTTGSGSVSLNPSGGVYDSGTIVTLTATPASGYQFSGWSGDLSGSTNPATIAMDANKNVTATFTQSSSGGQVVYEETKTGGSSSSTTVTSASITGVSGHLYLAAISTKNKVSVLGVSGLGLSWTLVRSQCAGRDQTGVEVWMAQGTPNGNGTVTATFAAVPYNAVIAVSRYSGMDAVNPIGSVVSGNTNGINGACSGGSDNASYAFNLTTTVNGAMVYGTVAMRNKTHTPGAGYTERAEIMQGGGGRAASIAVQDKSVAGASTVAVNGSFSGSVDWAVVGLEIKPSSGGGGGTQYILTTNVVGSGSVNPASGTYSSGAVVTLTVIPASGYQFSSWSGDLSGSTNPATITMDGNKNVTATFTVLPPTQYSLTVNTSGSGSVSLNPPGGTYDAGTLVTLTATPASGYQFSGWSGDLSGSTNPATITMDGNKNVTATFMVSGGGSGQVVYKETQTGGSTSSTTVATAANLTAGNGDLYLAAIASKPNVVVSSVSGLGLTWTLVKAQCAGRSQTRVEVWMAQGTPNGDGMVTATLSAVPSAAVIAVSRYSGADAGNPIGNLISGNTTGANGACSGGVDNASYSFSMSTTINGAMIYGAVAMRNNTHTPGAGYTERAEIMASSGGSAASVAVQEQSFAAASTVTVDGSFSGSVDWAVVAVEIKPQITVSKRGTIAAREATALPPAFQLEPNYPNPFNPSTQIHFGLPQASHVTIKVYAINGAEIKTLVDGDYPAGRHAITFRAGNLPSGTYFYVMQAGEIRKVRRLVLLK